jgi:hypothetical protein
MKKIMWLVHGYEPFLPIDSIREIESYADGCPIIRDLQGHLLILSKPYQYKILNNENNHYN